MNEIEISFCDAEMESPALIKPLIRFEFIFINWFIFKCPVQLGKIPSYGRSFAFNHHCKLDSIYKCSKIIRDWCVPYQFCSSNALQNRIHVKYKMKRNETKHNILYIVWVAFWMVYGKIAMQTPYFMRREARPKTKLSINFINTFP